MALFLTESDVLELLPMERAIEHIESSFIAQHKGEAINRARERIFLPHSSFHYMAAGLPQENLLGGQSAGNENLYRHTLRLAIRCAAL